MQSCKCDVASQGCVVVRTRVENLDDVVSLRGPYSKDSTHKLRSPGSKNETVWDPGTEVCSLYMLKRQGCSFEPPEDHDDIATPTQKRKPRLRTLSHSFASVSDPTIVCRAVSVGTRSSRGPSILRGKPAPDDQEKEGMSPLPEDSGERPLQASFYLLGSLNRALVHISPWGALMGFSDPPQEQGQPVANWSLLLCTIVAGLLANEGKRIWCLKEVKVRKGINIDCQLTLHTATFRQEPRLIYLRGLNSKRCVATVFTGCTRCIKTCRSSAAWHIHDALQSQTWTHRCEGPSGDDTGLKTIRRLEDPSS
ncbi:hypothetical protein BDV96DRAFT_597011 [Lophiotrema nucula]|uniref:Uncharacterized protein n=1 Tax=Lophiotrema nucula TaxID=690887 RepID=A0A6A5ZH87_9PLEO|nr:hypothetical protein BDV96DRAFT_597011 [Lophiotrema nucula]